MIFDQARKVIAYLSIAVIVIAIIVAGFDDRMSKPMLKNGDMLGQDTGESFAQYHQRAQESAETATGDSFALITLNRPLEPDHAGQVAAQLELRRVNAIVFSQRPPIEIPEPVKPATRMDVMVKATPEGELVSGIIAFDNAEQLVSAAEHPAIAAVEVLPSDAAWGRFGIRPVNPQS